jgi:hypothetical protein
MSYRILSTKTEAELRAAKWRMAWFGMLCVASLLIAICIGRFAPKPSLPPTTRDAFFGLSMAWAGVCMFFCFGVFLLSIATIVEDWQVRSNSTFGPLIFVELPGATFTGFGGLGIVIMAIGTISEVFGLGWF